MSVESTTLSTDTTAKRDHTHPAPRPRRRATPRDGATTQVIQPIDQCGADNIAPTVSISPATGGSYTSAALAVTVTWRDDVALDAYSYYITLNGVDVTSQFNYSGSTRLATSSGSVTLQPGQNTFTAETWDQYGNWGYRTVTWTYTAPVNNTPAPLPARADDPA
ncbi:MAG TPA: hypothetical protein VFJ82_17205, partial [Longimicrobium sp.]|nr:hypothetical protein [Longimicrobium sp.]